MSINESASPVTPLVEVQSAADRGPDLVVPAAIDPNDPPWGIPHALIVWVLSVVLIVVVPILAILPYVVYRMITQGAMLDLVNDTTLIFISILAVLPAHILTLVIVWLVVTSRGRRPFLGTLGWTWPGNFGPVKCIGLAVLLLIVAVLLTWLFGGAETQLDQIVKSSLKARFVLAFLAVFTAPLVEEVIYRGIMYPALQRAIGTLWAVAIVSILFAGVHVFQYFNNLAVVSVIAVLSVTLTLVRSRTRSLLPCFVIHLVFNGLQALFLVFQPLIERYANQQKAVTALFIQTLPRFLP
ncbi:MAG TPA: type II CAAX endopeptidase family protein [Pyrinomonadaceae bacterium]|nr:type II CAAX endopeptidase family protein [Pyrinomonadaceae bacterium]